MIARIRRRTRYTCIFCGAALYTELLPRRLSSGSLGQFSFQATVTFENIRGHTFGAGTTVATADNFQAIEIATICNYGGILINDKYKDLLVIFETPSQYLY